MNPRHLVRRVSVATIAIVAIIAIAAFAGTATAAKKKSKTKKIASSGIANNAIQSKHIKNGTISVADLSKKTRNALKGANGADGAPGAAGAKGATGATGPKGEKGEKGEKGADAPAAEYGAGGVWIKRTESSGVVTKYWASHVTSPLPASSTGLEASAGGTIPFSCTLSVCEIALTGAIVSEGNDDGKMHAHVNIDKRSSAAPNGYEYCTSGEIGYQAPATRVDVARTNAYPFPEVAGLGEVPNKIDVAPVAWNVIGAHWGSLGCGITISNGVITVPTGLWTINTTFRFWA